MTAEEFNKKYEQWLEPGFYGLQLNKPEAVKYLDRKFEEFTTRDNFKYYQIKAKFFWFCFYADGVTQDEQVEVEKDLKLIYDK